MNELGRRSTLQGRACGRVPGLPSRCNFDGMMWCDAKDIIVRRVELHHPEVYAGGRQALPRRAKVRKHPRAARLPALAPCHVHVLTAPCARTGNGGQQLEGIFSSGLVGAWRGAVGGGAIDGGATGDGVTVGGETGDPVGGSAMAAVSPAAQPHLHPHPHASPSRFTLTSHPHAHPHAYEHTPTPTPTLHPHTSRARLPPLPSPSHPYGNPHSHARAHTYSHTLTLTLTPMLYTLTPTLTSHLSLFTLTLTLTFHPHPHPHPHCHSHLQLHFHLSALNTTYSANR